MEILRLIYTPNKPQNEKIRILGHEFVKNNENKGKIIHNNKKFRLSHYFSGWDNDLDYLKIGIILSENFINKTSMFKDCKNLVKVSRYASDLNFEYKDNFDDDRIFEYKLNEYESENEFNFYHNHLYKTIDTDLIISEINYSELEEKTSTISIISSFKDNIILNQYNYSFFDNMFYDCNNLSSLKDIFRKDNEKIINMSRMFYNCSSLSSLPDISKWDTNNVTNMSKLFYNCSSLSSLPDISNVPF